MDCWQYGLHIHCSPAVIQTAACGHFGSSDLNVPWEQTDMADMLRQEAGLKSAEKMGSAQEHRISPRRHKGTKKGFAPDGCEPPLHLDVALSTQSGWEAVRLPVSPHRTAIALKSYRVHTEDRADVFECPVGTVAVVADGVGGRSGGAAAADVVISRIRAHMLSLASVRTSDLTALLRRIDNDLLEDQHAGQTTAVFAVVTDRAIVGAAVGDSEAWLIGRQADRVLTHVSKPFLGTGEARPDSFRCRLSDETLLLATDGLFRYVEAGDIVEAALHTDIDVAATVVAGLPRRENGMPPDDIAVVLVRRLPSEAASSQEHSLPTLSERWRKLFYR